MPAAVYIHGGGTILGDRKTIGLGATLANHEGALFIPLRRQLNARGFVVASIDYRPPTSTTSTRLRLSSACAWRSASGDSAGTRRAMSPDTYVTADAPPFLVLHGDRDEDVFPRHSFGFAKRLRAAGVPTTLIEVHGTGHTLDTPGQRPSPGNSPTR